MKADAIAALHVIRLLARRSMFPSAIATTAEDVQVRLLSAGQLSHPLILNLVAT
jgi:hypothetical protein